MHSFQAILNQAIHQLGCHWQYGGPTYTTYGFHYCVHVSLEPGPVTSPLLSVISRPCAQTCEARESALMNILLYINDVLGYIMSDIHYTDYHIRHGG